MADLPIQRGSILCTGGFCAKARISPTELPTKRQAPGVTDSLTLFSEGTRTNCLVVRRLLLNQTFLESGM
jgi:hypothetical protein